MNTINLKGLSHLTGFSISTVSKALNDRVDISEKTKQKINCVAKKYNYIPNSFAAGLRNKKSSTIAIIVPQINIDSYSNMLSNFQKIANEHGYRTMIFQSYESRQREDEYLKSICDGSVDGAILISEEPANLYSKDYVIPTLSVTNQETHCNEEIELFCSQIFDKLLLKFS